MEGYVHYNDTRSLYEIAEAYGYLISDNKSLIGYRELVRVIDGKRFGFVGPNKLLKVINLEVYKCRLNSCYG